MVPTEVNMINMTLFPYFYLGGCRYWCDSAAFLFLLVKKPDWQPLKLDQGLDLPGVRRYSIYSCSSYGPTFGRGHDIYIADNAGSSNNSYTNLGHTYHLPPGGYLSFLAGTFNF